MSRSFYEYTQTCKGMLHPDPCSELAESISEDLQFPKHETNYHVVSDYLETNVYYVESMDVFDELWQKYQDSKK